MIKILFIIMYFIIYMEEIEGKFLDININDLRKKL
jgi:hypothetical protein